MMRRLVPVLALLACAAVAHAEGEPPMAPVEASESPIFQWHSPVGELAYTPGRGLSIGAAALTLGGYADMTWIRDEGERSRISLEDLSLFVIWDPIERLHFFSELEYHDVFDLDESGTADSRSDAATVERLYVDIGVSDAVNLRAGIFLTPVGRWNVIHAAPLVWTTSRPLTTRIPFDPDVTGLMLWGTFFPGKGALTYSLFDQFAKPIEGDPDFQPADHSLGGRLQWDVDSGWSFGASYLAARRGGDWRHLGGLDFLWARRPLEIMGEAIVDAGEGGAPQWGFYVQPVLALTSRLSLVGRYEHYAQGGPPPQLNLITTGIDVRLLPTVVLKVEYEVVDRSSRTAPAGLRTSIAVLF